MHRTIRRLAVIGSMVAIAGTLAAGAAGAGDSLAVGGVIVPTGQSLTTREAGGNVVVDGSGTHAWGGSFAGTSTVDTHFVIHASGSVTYQGVIIFTGETPCGYGTIAFNASGSGPFPGPMSGQATTIDQGAATIDLHASLDTTLFLTPSGALLTYTGAVRCGSGS